MNSRETALANDSSIANYLFVCGCPRSGTTALWRLLTADGQCLLGVERYGTRFFGPKFISPDLFEKTRFLRLEAGDTFYKDLVAFSAYYEDVGLKFSTAKYVGDKIPKLYNFLGPLSQNFPECKVIMIVRNIFDVAASYKARLLNENDRWQHDVDAAIRDWNQSLENGLAQFNDLDLLVLDYEEIFSGQTRIEKIYEFLELPVTRAVQDQYSILTSKSSRLEKARKRDLSVSEVKSIALNANFDAYRKLLALAA